MFAKGLVYTARDRLENMAAIYFTTYLATTQPL